MSADRDLYADGWTDGYARALDELTDAAEKRTPAQVASTVAALARERRLAALTFNPTKRGKPTDAPHPQP